MIARLYALAAGVALAACAPPATPAPGNAPAEATPKTSAQSVALVEIPGVTVSYYEVSGDSIPAIRQALNAARPRDPNDGAAVDALSRWYIGWRWPAGADGSCDLARAEIRFTATVQFPRLATSRARPAAVQARWQAYLAVLERHEGEHVRHAYQRRGEVLAAIRASTCAGANDAGLAAVHALARWDLDYDRTTRHGFTEGAHFP
jgi:predicted secreted Zn-dependent protease